MHKNNTLKSYRPTKQNRQICTFGVQNAYKFVGNNARYLNRSRYTPAEPIACHLCMIKFRNVKNGVYLVPVVLSYITKKNPIHSENQLLRILDVI